MVAEKVIETVVKQILKKVMNPVFDRGFREQCPHDGCENIVIEQSSWKKSKKNTVKELVRLYREEEEIPHYDTEMHRKIVEPLGVEVTGTMVCCEECRGYIEFDTNGVPSITEDNQGNTEEVKFSPW